MALNPYETADLIVSDVQDRRHSPRRSLEQVFVELESRSAERSSRWLAQAHDINADGLGLRLPNKLEPGEEVRLTFRLPGVSFERVRGRVVHRGDRMAGGLRFTGWSFDDRQALDRYLTSRRH